MKITIARSLIATLAFLGSSLAWSGMEALSEKEMGEVVGQALFVSDFINGSDLDAANGNTGDPSRRFNFYRMGLDVELAMNANIDKLALGCGGANSALAGAPNCDIDFDFVSFMGRDGAQAGAPVTSDFTLLRPFVELAVDNDDTATLREVVGFKIGSEQADGFVSIGRRYAQGQVNQETGQTCGTGANAIHCHSGINSISGALRAEMSASVPVRVRAGCVFGLCALDTLETACFGNTSANDPCGTGDRFFTDLVGTRMTAAGLQDVPLKLEGGILSFFGIDEAVADVSESLRFIHGFALQNTSDFGLSFQRERVSFPNFNKTGFSTAANTGWWMNVPDVKILDIVGDQITIQGVGDALSALGEGVNLENIELGQTPAINCFGNNAFC